MRKWHRSDYNYHKLLYWKNVKQECIIPVMKYTEGVMAGIKPSPFRSRFSLTMLNFLL
uniref:Uncharacterized protein n=1 Tax=Anguilla anguilla TaxID=7936 RepID=A0A0E9Q5U5_ANGAN